MAGAQFGEFRAQLLIAVMRRIESLQNLVRRESCRRNLGQRLPHVWLGRAFANQARNALWVDPRARGLRDIGRDGFRQREFFIEPWLSGLDGGYLIGAQIEAVLAALMQPLRRRARSSAPLAAILPKRREFVGGVERGQIGAQAAALAARRRAGPIVQRQRQRALMFVHQIEGKVAIVARRCNHGRAGHDRGCVDRGEKLGVGFDSGAATRIALAVCSSGAAGGSGLARKVRLSPAAA